ncbi:hypothetical protein EXIGLDRAFT_783566 [Exidia glandulosa HHB12029]|uniref:Uncharacterized protein n=1 Tax=Exidia glandulosa HHB12029 TaxID=1314781 RepID=A0A166MZP6_EXIGL|nr:hypothetical protein EXIGLDRAFT_783566 [Exidia glandulosa HHB12029]
MPSLDVYDVKHGQLSSSSSSSTLKPRPAGPACPTSRSRPPAHAGVDDLTDFVCTLITNGRSGPHFASRAAFKAFPVCSTRARMPSPVTTYGHCAFGVLERGVQASLEPFAGAQATLNHVYALSRLVRSPTRPRRVTVELEFLNSSSDRLPRANFSREDYLNLNAASRTSIAVALPERTTYGRQDRRVGPANVIRINKGAAGTSNRIDKRGRRFTRLVRAIAAALARSRWLGCGTRSARGAWRVQTDLHSPFKTSNRTHAASSINVDSLELPHGLVAPSELQKQPLLPPLSCSIRPSTRTTLRRADALVQRRQCAARVGAHRGSFQQPRNAYTSSVARSPCTFSRHIKSTPREYAPDSKRRPAAYAAKMLGQYIIPASTPPTPRGMRWIRDEASENSSSRAVMLATPRVGATRIRGRQRPARLGQRSVPRSPPRIHESGTSSTARPSHCLKFTRGASNSIQTERTRRRMRDRKEIDANGRVYVR